MGRFLTLVMMSVKVNGDMLVAQYRAMYPAGTVLELTATINDEFTPKDIGDRFIVNGVDDIGQIHGRFLSGGSMAIIPEVDKFKIVTEKQ